MRSLRSRGTGPFRCARTVPPERQPERRADEQGGEEREPHRHLDVLLLEPDVAGQVRQDLAEPVGVLGAEVLATGDPGDLGERLLVDLLEPAAATATAEVEAAPVAAERRVTADLVGAAGHL